jgi:hypothetical protein
MLGSATIRAHGCTISIYRQCCVVRAPCVNVICSSCSRTQLLVTLPADIWMREIPAPLFFFLLSLFFSPSPVIPHVQPLSGEWKRKKEKSYCIIYHCCPTPFHPSCLVVWAFFPSLLSILFYLFYTGAGLLLLSERNLSWRSYPTQRIAI